MRPIRSSTTLHVVFSKYLKMVFTIQFANWLEMMLSVKDNFKTSELISRVICESNYFSYLAQGIEITSS